MTAVALAKRLGVTPASVSDLGNSEKNGTITLNSLRKVAAAMGCDVVYAIIPRTTLDDILKQRADEKARSMLGRVSHSMKLEALDVELSQAHQQVEALGCDGKRVKRLRTKSATPEVSFSPRRRPYRRP